MKVVGYARVSTEDQSRDGVSLAAQGDKIRGYARLHDLELAEVVVDAGVSAKTLDRPGLARVLAMLDSGDVGGLIIYKLDRLTRNLGDWSGLIERYFGDKGGKALMSIEQTIDTRTAAGRMCLNMMMTVAQWERETIVERTRSAVNYKRGRGERIGTVPYGKVLGPDGRGLIPDPAEEGVLAQIREWDAQDWPLRKIAAELQARGVPTKSGRPWSHATVQRLVRRTA